MMKKTKLLSAKEVGEYLGLTRRSIYNLIQSGELSGLKIGGVWRFKEEDVETYLERSRKSGRTKYHGRVFPFWIMTRYYQAPQKYQITKKGQTGWLSLREEYLSPGATLKTRFRPASGRKKLTEAERKRTYFKPIKYRRIRLWYGETAIMVSPHYFARLPQSHQQEWLKAEIKHSK